MGKHYNGFANYLVAAALTLLILLIYSQVHDFSLTYYDDPENISMNVRVQQGLSLENIRWALTTTYANFRMPLVWISFMVDREIIDFLSSRGIVMGADGSGVYHLTNVLIHIVGSVLLFVVLNRMTNCCWQSAFVAALFAVHPLHVEPVAWATSRKDVLSGLFWMLTMLAYAYYARRPSTMRYMLLLLTFVLGLMAKPMLVSLPLVLLMLDWWPLGRIVGSPKTSDSRFPIFRSPLFAITEKLPLFVLTALSSFLAYSAQQQGGALGPVDTYPVGVRIPNALVSYFAYVRQTIWPTGLIPFYPHPGRTLPEVLVAACAIGLILITFLAVRTRRTKPYLIVGWLWYLTTLVPVSGLVQVGNHARADRYTYIPLIGLFVIAAWGVSELTAAWKYQRPILAAAACAVILAFTAISHRQAGYWRDDFTLFDYTLRVSPRNPVAHNDIGIALLKQGKLRESIKHFNAALEVWPGYATAYNNIGVVYEGLGRLDEAVANYEMAISVAPYDTDPCVHWNLGRTLGKQGRITDAIKELSAALRIAPEFPGVHNDLGRVLELQGKIDEAIKCFRRELELVPDNGDAHFNLGRILLEQKRKSEAVRHLQQAIMSKPRFGAAHLELGHALLAVGDQAGAIRHYRAAFRLMPRSSAAANSLAWNLATSPDASLRNGQEAVRAAVKACRLTKHADPSALDTLAAAYAETGNFREAVRNAEKGVWLARKQGFKELAEEISKRATLYRTGRPYHSGPTSQK
jgi:tetratricopeptide (TPR) repeat protein